ncbi:ABC transporter ATP-binding protein [Janibacter sp. G56]|uniref:ABC transporter ATP-binding protein n=1 Tax=Janibacter sp. G56 TaxID=3418717 RepID=UPI003CFC9635
MSTLTVTGVSASYGSKEVLHDVDLVVPTGTTTAILGPSGCGKTTLLRVIAGFRAPSAGRVAIDDRDVVADGVWVAPERRGIGYVAQEGNLFPHLDIAHNLTFGLNWRERRASAGVPELLELVGLDPELARRRPDQLSGGQQQRVALARALARKPGLVLLDEPFSSLDTALRASTRASVAQALAATGTTVVLVTHDQSEALSFADQVAIMRAGRFAHVGPPPDVYHSPVDPHAAAFLGDAVMVSGRVVAGSGAGSGAGRRVISPLGELETPDALASVEGLDVEVMLRPEQLRLVRSGHTGPPLGTLDGSTSRLGPRGTAQGVVVDTTYYGHDALVSVRLEDDAHTVVQARTTGSAMPSVGERVGVTVDGPARIYPLA